MEEDDPSSILAHKAHLLETLIPPLSSSTSKLCSRSRTIPSNKDFHFYNNFPEFKRPNKEIQSKLQSSLESLSSSSNIFDSKKQPPLPSDLDDSYDWLVNLNDEFVERFNISLDEFRRPREKEEGKDGNLKLEEGGFQLVRNKKKKGSSMDEAGKDEGLGSSSGVKIGLKYKKAVAVKSKVPFHIPTIRRPQDEFNILVNNVNQPFEHVWLERSEDGKRVIHPLEKMSVLDFIDRSIGDVEIAKPLPLESTPFKLVEGVKDLKELAAKLQDVKEFAVDLEHNQYRSFQGLTCLMQISTRTEDFIIDTLKLRVHIGPYLREVFKDPSKRKVMHGADRDIEWLQRDFGIYVCNLFDTGQASRVLQLERNSLEYLLHHFCGVSANKEYQAADWRLRPIPDEMLKYGREDTHYLLHIYDLMKLRLLSASPDDDLLLEVYKRSYDICIHLYQKELLTDTSFLYIYGLQEADFNSKQLSIASELYAWRDQVAREEDESTGYILPNKILLEIAREMPVSSGKLRRLVKSKHSLVERHLNTVINLIRGAIENSSEFDSIAEELRNARLESTRQKLAEASTDVEMVAGTEDPMDSTISERDALDVTGNSENLEASENAMDVNVKPANAENLGGIFFGKQQEKEKTQPMSIPETGCAFKISDTDGTIEKEKMDYVNTDLLQSNKKGSISSVQVLKKTSGFGSLLGNSASRRKLNPGLGGVLEQDKNMNKVEQIKSSVVLPFHSFAGSGNISEPNPSEGIKQTQPETRQQHPIEPSATAQLEEVIRLNNDDSDDSSEESPCANDGLKCRERSPRQENGSGEVSHLETEAGEQPISLSDLSSSFQQCFQSINQDRSSYKKNGKQSQENEVKVQVKPFDYAAARKIINFTGVREHDGDGGLDSNPLDSGEKRRASAAGRSNNGEGRERGLRRQAFPPSGNRSTTYK